MRYLLFITCVLIGFSVRLQPRTPYIQNFTNKVYGKKSNPEIYCVVQDTNNLLIAGTSRGVKVYNGSSWDFVGVRDGSYVTALTRNDQGAIYVGAVGDFGQLRKRRDGSYYFHSLAKGLNISEPVWRVHCIGEQTFFQTESALYVFQKNKLQHTILPKTSIHMTFKVGNRLLIRQRDLGIFEVKEKKLVAVDQSERVRNFGVFAIFEEQGQLRYAIRDENSPVLWERSVYGGIRLHDGNYLINTLQEGVFVLNRKMEVINHISKLKGISDNDVKSCYQGSDGNIWLATNNGISYIEYQSDISYYNAYHGIEGDVQDVIQTETGMFVASSKGIFRELNGIFIPTNIRVASWEFTKQGNLYCATSEGLMCWRNNRFEPVLKGNFNNVALIRGSYYLSGPNGVLITTTGFKTITSIDLPLNQTLGIYDDRQRNEIWIGTAVLGVLRIMADGSFDIYNDDQDGLNIAWIKPISNYDGKLVFATSEGLQRFIYEEEMIKLLPDSLRDMPELARGTFEPIASNEEISALFRFKDKKLAVVSNEVKEFKNYNYTPSPYNCLDFGRINRIRVIAGFGYICTSDGLIVLEKNAGNMRSDFKLSFSQIRSGDTTINFREAAVFDYASNNVSFYFQAPFYLHGSQVRYRYKLEGNDTKWSEWITDNHISFSNLMEGDYVLCLEAENSLGERPPVLKFAFSITPPWFRTWWAYGLYLILLAGGVWLAVHLGRRHLKRRNEELEQVVLERTREIAHQKELIEEKHLEITDSINYAQRIQSALMTSDEHWQNLGDGHFVLFKPRDVVSGDFYWAWQNEDVAIWAAADCTGHGVPGAFMSMLGIGFLNEIVIEGKEHRPAVILDSLRHKIIHALEQKSSTDERKDGMDIALCCLDRKSNTVSFAGANNPLILITRNQEKALAMQDDKMMQFHGAFLLTIPGDKMPVGKFVFDDRRFTEHQLQLDPGDLCYTLSDGFPDQFGGHEGKKFMIKRLKQLLLQLAHQDLPLQKERLEEAFQQWLKDGNTEQIDDVCVVGVKIPSL